MYRTKKHSTNDRYWNVHMDDIIGCLTEVYYRIDISEEQAKEFCNDKLDYVLKYIGCVFGTDDDSLSVFAKAYKIILEIANADNKHKCRYSKWVTKNQIKALRKAFRKIYYSTDSNSVKYYVKIPYNTYEILNSIHTVLDGLAPDDKFGVVCCIGEQPLSRALAEKYISLFVDEWYKNHAGVSRIDKARILYSNVHDMNQPANRTL